MVSWQEEDHNRTEYHEKSTAARKRFWHSVDKARKEYNHVTLRLRKKHTHRK
jgi:hypothetical protein